MCIFMYVYTYTCTCTYMYPYAHAAEKEEEKQLEQQDVELKNELSAVIKTAKQHVLSKWKSEAQP